jgi:uncharacterized membrane protein YdcZ (DUF606 family)
MNGNLMEWVYFFLQVTIGFVGVGLLPPILYFEIRYRFKKSIANPPKEGLTFGIIWGVLFIFITGYYSSPVGASMAVPFIIIGFPILGQLVGSFYRKRNGPLIRAGRRKFRGT